MGYSVNTLTMDSTLYHVLNVYSKLVIKNSELNVFVYYSTLWFQVTAIQHVKEVSPCFNGCF